MPRGKIIILPESYEREMPPRRRPAGSEASPVGEACPARPSLLVYDRIPLEAARQTRGTAPSGATMSESDFQRYRSCSSGEHLVAARQTNASHNRFELLIPCQNAHVSTTLPSTGRERWPTRAQRVQVM